MSYTYKYPRPAVTADCIVIAKDNGDPKVLLIQRKHEPFKDCWAFPGGFVDEGETATQAASRELKEETSLENITFTQYKAVSSPGRDPRGWVIAIVFYAIVSDSSTYTPQAQDDAADVNWLSLDELPTLAFDHHEVLQSLLQIVL